MQKIQHLPTTQAYTRLRIDSSDPNQPTLYASSSNSLFEDKGETLVDDITTAEINPNPQTTAKKILQVITEVAQELLKHSAKTGLQRFLVLQMPSRDSDFFNTKEIKQEFENLGMKVEERDGTLLASTEGIASYDKIASRLSILTSVKVTFSKEPSDGNIKVRIGGEYLDRMANEFVEVTPKEFLGRKAEIDYILSLNPSLEYSASTASAVLNQLLRDFGESDFESRANLETGFDKIDEKIADNWKGPQIPEKQVSIEFEGFSPEDNFVNDFTRKLIFDLQQGTSPFDKVLVGSNFTPNTSESTIHIKK